MAWVNRTSRDQGPGNFQPRSAASHLGPGCYETSPIRKVKPNAIGFGCSERVDRGAAGNAGATKGHALVTPGPGAYSSNNQVAWESPSKSKSSASAVFQSKSQRLVGETRRGGRKGSTPGPGTYASPEAFSSSKKKTLSALLNEPSKGSKLKWARLPTAPSIPTVSQSFGYEQGAHGKLVRHQPVPVGHSGRSDDTSGPGEYDPLRGLKSVNKSRTTDFSKGKMTRIFEQEIQAKAAVPGPGEYRNPSDASASKDAMRASSVFKSSITRDRAAVEGRKQSVPGPGAYDGGSKSFVSEPKPEHLQFFGSTVTRFDDVQRELLGPGPGAYYAPPSMSRPISFGCRKSKKAPFCSKTDRFESLRTRDQPLAAPGSYDMPSSLSDTLNKVTSRVSTFGSTTKRFDSLSSSSEHGPETYESQLERDMKPGDDNKQQHSPSSRSRHEAKPSSVFASASTRFQHATKAAGPSPGDYESSWSSSGAEGTFKSASERMTSKSGRDADVPGPGAYSAAPVRQKPVHMARPDVFFGAVRCLLLLLAELRCCVTREGDGRARPAGATGASIQENTSEDASPGTLFASNARILTTEQRGDRFSFASYPAYRDLDSTTQAQWSRIGTDQHTTSRSRPRWSSQCCTSAD
ncbi:hypothetical protein PybrP1_004588 [[Pythium] brassicae (nom. inval.)]|nr:hypothetical protein PybrP1_004588 [[Pythium] brassicae (nom. inval.)]